MAKTYISLSNNISEFKDRINDVTNLIGDLSTLTTVQDSDLVAVINELDSDIGPRPHLNLITSSKNLVQAVNEVKVAVDLLDSDATVTSALIGDLTTLQTEAFRSLRISPKDTLAIAQDLYTKGYTSYPRTSSQQLPQELGLKKLIEELKRNPHYKTLAEKLLTKNWIKPNNGKKTDPAHPAIYPTGIIPSDLEGRDFKVYDLIVRRFLATFADPAIRETNKIIRSN